MVKVPERIWAVHFIEQVNNEIQQKKLYLELKEKYESK